MKVYSQFSLFVHPVKWGQRMLDVDLQIMFLLTSVDEATGFLIATSLFYSVVLMTTRTLFVPKCEGMTGEIKLSN